MKKYLSPELELFILSKCDTMTVSHPTTDTPMIDTSPDEINNNNNNDLII